MNFANDELANSHKTFCINKYYNKYPCYVFFYKYLIMVRFNFPTIFIRHLCHREAILAIMVCTAGLSRTPHHPTTLSLFIFIFFFLDDNVRFLFSFWHRHENCPAFACPNRDRRRCDFVGIFLPKIVHTYRHGFIYRLPSSIAVCVIRVGFVALFRTELQPRNCVSLRFWFFNVIALCSSCSSHLRTIYFSDFPL